MSPYEPFCLSIALSADVIWGCHVPRIRGKVDLRLTAQMNAAVFAVPGGGDLPRNLWSLEFGPSAPDRRRRFQMPNALRVFVLDENGRLLRFARTRWKRLWTEKRTS